MIAYFVVHLPVGWLAGKAYALLMRARASGKFTLLHWGIFIASMLGAMLFARFVIGGAKRMPNLAVGLSAIAVSALFVWTSGMLRSGRSR